MSLRSLAQARRMEFGCAVGVAAMRDTAYCDLVARECGVVVAENASKYGPLCPAEGRYEFDGFDRIVAFAEGHRMKVRGHTLVWHQQTPTWLASCDQVCDALRGHIARTVGRYRGRIESWDVVNEAIDDEAGLRDTLYLRELGKGYIEWAFRQAHEADPSAQLVYNDYSIEEENPKSDAVYRLVQTLVDRGVPIHAIGLQAHLELVNPPDPESVAKNIKRFRALGLEVLVTEMDVRIPEPFEAGKRIDQAKVYGDFVAVCVEEGVERILTWGITDRYSWIPGFFKGTGEALPFDRDLRPKPAYDAIVRALS